GGGWQHHIIAAGTVSYATGGKFADGAKTMAYIQLFTSAAKFYEESVGRPANPLPGENRKGQTTYESDPKTGQQPLGTESMNVLGLNLPLEHKFVADLGKQGSFISKVLNLIPGGNATAGLHDFWFNKGNPNKLEFTTFNNISTMFIAAPISIAATIGNIAKGNESLVYTHLMVNDRDR
ncbi:MAG: hypothetical protein COA42_19905, partial [Alteromonadaceae bacterium]